MASGSLADALGQLISGAGAGVAATFITNPLDTMKVEAQNGGMSAAEMITRPGLLWRGITVVLIETAFCEKTHGVPRVLLCPALPNLANHRDIVSFSDNGLNFGVYEILKAQWVLRRAAGNVAALMPAVTNLLLGAVAGAATSIGSCPIKVVAMRLQAGTETNAAAAVANVFKESGPVGFFTGTTIGLMLIPADTAIQFFCFERLKWLIRQSFGAVADSAGVALVLGGLAKCLAVAAVYPPRRAKDVLMSQSKAKDKSAEDGHGEMQEKTVYTGMMDCLAGTARTRGLAGLYSGMIPDMGSNFVKRALMFWFKGLSTAACVRMMAALLSRGKLKA